MDDRTSREERREERQRRRDDDPADDEETRPMKAVLKRLVQDGTLTEEQARAVQEAVREERRSRRR